jgi:hypothetical protein
LKTLLFWHFMSTNPAVAFLPTIEKLRASVSADAEVPPYAPQDVERLAMLVVQVALVRRTSFTEEVASAPGHLERGEPPMPNDYEPRHHVRIDERLGGATCLACTDRPGFRRCRVCGGRGRILNDNWLCSCTAGWITCSTCGGRQENERVRLRYYSDVPAFLNEAYMPTHISQEPALFRLETMMEENLLLTRALPEELRCHDLTGEVVGTAYRGGQRTVRPLFHGHDFGDAIDKALAGLSAVGAGASVVRYQIHAYAWPFLRLRWMDHPDVIMYVDRQGAVRLFRGQ